MADPVVLRTPRRRLFVGSYADVAVVIDPATGIAFDDLRFEVPDGPEAGIVSLSRDRRFNIERPTILLLAGSRPGRYILQAFHVPTDSLVAEAKFGITDLWTNDAVGPRLWFDGINQRQENPSYGRQEVSKRSL